MSEKKEEDRIRSLEERIQQLEVWQETKAREYSDRIRDLERWKAATYDGVMYASVKEKSMKSAKSMKVRLDTSSPKNASDTGNFEHFFQSFRSSDKYDYDLFISYRRDTDDDVSAALFYSLVSDGLYQGDVFHGTLRNY